jgi:hypothetical protein
LATHCNYDLTDHAKCRAQQRGVTLDTLNFVISHSDIWLHAGEGCRSARISHKQLGELSQEGLPASLIERATNVVVVVDPVSGSIVTVLHDHGSRSGRKYRTQWPTRSQKWRRNNRGRDNSSALSFSHYQNNQKKLSVH